MSSTAVLTQTPATPAATKATANNKVYLELIVNAQNLGEGCLPPHLGLNDVEFEHLMDTFFGGANNTVNCDENALLRQDLLEMREQEWQELVELLNQNVTGVYQSEAWLAKIVAAGCMGGGHLWRDLGLPSRDVLRNLMLDNFKTLAEKNTGNMRWKKFLYRQLCESGGHFVCRSPSCETCSTYEECFGDEE